MIKAVGDAAGTGSVIEVGAKSAFLLFVSPIKSCTTLCHTAALDPTR